jgi:hypothetical protein
MHEPFVPGPLGPVLAPRLLSLQLKRAAHRFNCFASLAIAGKEAAPQELNSFHP